MPVVFPILVLRPSYKLEDSHMYVQARVFHRSYVIRLYKLYTPTIHEILPKHKGSA